MLNNVYCCRALDSQIQDKYCPIKYSKKWREYSVRDFSSTSLSLMMFCPNCGARLPFSLRDQWFDLLEQEYGLEDPMDEDKKKIPKEFTTDEWWKKRELKNKNEDIDFLSLEHPIRYLF